jgi:hypothetical protein
MSKISEEMKEEIRDAIRVAEQVYFNRLIGNGCPGLTMEIKYAEFCEKSGQLFALLAAWCEEQDGEVSERELNLKADEELRRMLGDPNTSTN